jgi:hypothetical protein
MPTRVTKTPAAPGHEPSMQAVSAWPRRAISSSPDRPAQASENNASYELATTGHARPGGSNHPLLGDLR